MLVQSTDAVVAFGSGASARPCVGGVQASHLWAGAGTPNVAHANVWEPSIGVFEPEKTTYTW